MLTKLQIDSLKPQSKAVRIFDGRGLYIELQPSGSRYWRFKYRFAGKERRLAFGVYPDVGLKDARDKLDEARQQLKAGIDPGEQRKIAKLLQVSNTETGFEAIAREWFAMHSPKWAPGHGSKIIRRLECDIFPWIGGRAMESITPMEVLACLRRIEARGANETAHRAYQNCGRVFRYAVATGRLSRDPSRDLADALAPVI
ncbi:MAG: Arm DNA-binding domain-containing protein, partial [Gammaproteobacteria bacterium]